MRILQICSMYYDNTLFKHMFEAMEAQGMESVVYVPKWSDNKSENNVYIISKRHNKLEKFLFWTEQEYILNDIETRIPIDTIDCIYAHRLLFGGHAALHLYKKYHIPYIVEICNSDIYGFGRNIFRFKNHSTEIMENAKRILFFSKTYMDYVLNKCVDRRYREGFQKKCEVLVSGIDQYFIDNTISIDSHSLPQEKQINIVFIGWIDKNKNLPTLIKACQDLLRRNYLVNLKVLGKIIENKIYQKAINHGFVEYLGFRSQNELLNILRQSDVFVLPSIHESFGLVYAEAMTQGTPILYTRGQGFDGQYEDGEVGYSINCFDEREIADRILDVLSDFRNISNRCIVNSQRYRWDVIAKRYKEIINQCI